MGEIYRIKKSSLDAVANALRQATFSNKNYTPAQMAQEILDQTALRKSLIERSIFSYNDESAIKISNSVFRGCTSLRNARFTEATLIGEMCFWGCTKLEWVDLHKATNLYSQVFANDTALQAVIIRTPKLCNLVYANAFQNSGISNGTGYVYVPAALVEEYKAATNWSTYASQIRAIEDYPEITGG